MMICGLALVVGRDRFCLGGQSVSYLRGNMDSWELRLRGYREWVSLYLPLHYGLYRIFLLLALACVLFINIIKRMIPYTLVYYGKSSAK